MFLSQFILTSVPAAEQKKSVQFCATVLSCIRATCGAESTGITTRPHFRLASMRVPSYRCMAIELNWNGVSWRLFIGTFATAHAMLPWQMSVGGENRSQDFAGAVLLENCACGEEIRAGPRESGWSVTNENGGASLCLAINTASITCPDL